MTGQKVPGQDRNVGMYGVVVYKLTFISLRPVASAIHSPWVDQMRRIIVGNKTDDEKSYQL